MSRSVPWINYRETNRDILFKYLNLCILFKCLVPWINERETNHDTLFKYLNLCILFKCLVPFP